ncbi:MAG: hypothetical protein A2Y40_01605 [Candidatus Margulisbacteria bacterium GWF2_35_9]|nr:MAG: hypothetical protein A2Y40_01605 [Candidatus Margulisbacteria bacterium GWF2_35_9]
MSCQDYQELMMKRFDRMGSEEESSMLQAHLISCQVCRVQFEKMEQSIRLYETKVSVKVPKNFEANVMLKVEAYAQSKRKMEAKLGKIFGFIFWVMITLPFAIIMSQVSTLNIPELFMLLLFRMDLLSNAFLAVLGTVKLTSIFLPIKYIMYIGPVFFGFLVGISFIVGQMLLKSKRSKI